MLACPKEGRSLQLFSSIVKAPLTPEPHVCVAVFEFFSPEVVGEGLLLLFTRLSRQIFCYLAHIGGVSNLLKRKKKKALLHSAKCF